MNISYLKIQWILIIGLLLTSCAAKKSTSSEDKTLKKFDAAAFDYVYAEALKQKLLGNGGDALRYLEQCVKINPESDAAYYQMAQIVIASNDLNNGKRYALKAYKLDDKNIWYSMMLSGIYYQQGNIDSAIVLYKRTAEYYPEKQNIQLALANLYLEKRDFKSSIEIYSLLESKYGINETTTPGYVNALIVSGNFNEALLKTEELIKSFPAGIQYYALLAEIYREKGDGVKAQEVYQKLLDENPDNPQIQLSVCDFLINEKKFEDLFLLLNPVILNPGINREDKLSLFSRLIAISDYSEENIDKIILSVMVLEAAYPEDDIVPLLRPEFLENIKRYKEAIVRLEEIISKKPGNYYAWEKLLLLYLQTSDFKQLMIKGEECATKFNRSFLVKLLYANGALENGKYEIAIDELRKAQILAGDNKAYMVQVLTMRADVYYRMKDIIKAFESYDEAIKIDNQDLTILNNYAYYLAEQNTRLKDAEEMALKVIEKEKDNPTFLDTYAWVLYKRGRSKDAAKIMESIIQNGTNISAEYYEHYAFILKSMRNCNKAIENWTKAISIDTSKTELLIEIENCTKK
jgi:tetratricopeptide (TPR) repeat protein